MLISSNSMLLGDLAVFCQSVTRIHWPQQALQFSIPSRPSFRQESRLSLA